MKRILVIDDDIQIRQMLKQMLEREKYEVVEASDGKRAMELYRQAPTDLVIVDIIMPVKGGIETIYELRRDFHDVKIIVMSGGSRLLNKDDYLNIYRAQDIPTLSKPFSRKELLEAINGLLEDVAVS